MFWRFMAPRDLAAILLGVAILVLLGFMYIVPAERRHEANDGFGPEWECTHPGRGEPVCVKKDLGQPGDAEPVQP